MTNSANYPDKNYSENQALSYLVTQIVEPEKKDTSVSKLFIALSVITLAAIIAYFFSIDPPYISAFSSSLLIVSGILLSRKNKKAKQPVKVTHHCGTCQSPLVEEKHRSKDFLVCHWCREFGEKEA